MIFFFKKPTVVVDFFTHRSDVIEFAPIDYAHRFYPNWWKKTPSSFINSFVRVPTIKRCNGILDTYKHGFIIPMWSDLAINVTTSYDSNNIENKNITWQYADHISTCESHDHKEWQTYADKNKYYNFKILSPWIAKSKSQVNFYLTKPFWNQPLGLPYEILSGTLNFKYNHGTNIQTMINIQTDFTYNIQALTPMAHIIPLTEKKLIIKNHLIDLSEWNSMHQNFLHTFENHYSKSLKIQKKFEKKCPFHKLTHIKK